MREFAFRGVVPLLLAAWTFIAAPPISAASRSIADIKIAAEKGDAQAQEELGDAFSMRLDSKQAEVWYRKAATAGLPTAQAKLGHMLFYRSRMSPGLPPAQKLTLGTESLKWLKPAANHGVHRAQADLATIYFEGRITKQDLVRTYMWGDLAAKAPITDASAAAGRAARDAAALQMSAKEIQTAQRLVKEFKPGQPSRPPSSSADTGIVLKGITGPADNRLALINNKTLSAGEHTQVKVGGEDLEIECVEVGEDFVVIKVGGHDHQLNLADR